MSELTTEDIIKLNEAIVVRVANCLNINTEERTFTQIFSDISDSKDSLYELVDNLIAIYRQYQNFHLIIDDKKKRGEQIAEADTETLMNHMKRRDIARQNLIDALVERKA